MRFVAPRNFKQGRLIMNQYRVSDLILLAVCTAFSFIFTIIYLTSWRMKKNICYFLYYDSIAFLSKKSG